MRRWRSELARWLWDERLLRLRHPEARILSCAGHLDALGHRVRRMGIEPLPRVYARLGRRLSTAVYTPGIRQPDLARSVVATAGVVLFGV